MAAAAVAWFASADSLADSETAGRRYETTPDCAVYTSDLPSQLMPVTAASGELASGHRPSSRRHGEEGGVDEGCLRGECVAGRLPLDFVAARPFFQDRRDSAFFFLAKFVRISVKHDGELSFFSVLLARG